MGRGEELVITFAAQTEDYSLTDSHGAIFTGFALHASVDGQKQHKHRNRDIAFNTVRVRRHRSAAWLQLVVGELPRFAVMREGGCREAEARRMAV